MTEEKKEPIDPLEHIKKDLMKGVRVNLVFGVIALAIAIGLCFIKTETKKDEYTKWGFVAFAGLMAVGSYRGAHTRMPKNSPLVFAIENDPDSIKQVYVRHNIINGGHNSTVLVFTLADAKVIIIQIPKGSDDEWMEHVKKLAPSATYGLEDTAAKPEETEEESKEEES